MVVPIFLKWSLEEYGFRSTLLLISGITMNCIFGAILIQPVQKHMKKVEIEEKGEFDCIANEMFHDKSHIPINIILISVV